MIRLFVFGLGYTATRLAARLPGTIGTSRGGTGRDGTGGTIRFDDEGAIARALAGASHVLSSVPPAGDDDPVLARYGDLLGGKWLGYLSSTGVYGDAAGAWVDESAATGSGRRSARTAADAAWLARGARVFRLPGIYGPGRSPLDRVREGRAHRTGIEGQVFSRVHVDDIVAGVIAGFDAAAGAYNLADDHPCSQDEVNDHAAALLGLPRPPLVALDTLSPMARAFYAENRRVANGKAKRVLGWTPAYPDYRVGLRSLAAVGADRALSATTSPMPVSSAPAIAGADQR